MTLLDFIVKALCCLYLLKYVFLVSYDSVNIGIGKETEDIISDPTIKKMYKVVDMCEEEYRFFAHIYHLTLP